MHPSLTSGKPQPASTDALARFPKRLPGSCQSISDNSLLTISDKAILRIYNFDHKKHISEQDSSYSLSGDTVIDLNNNLKTTFHRDGD